MTYPIVIEPTAQREIRSIIFTIHGDTVHILYVRHTARDELEP